MGTAKSKHKREGEDIRSSDLGIGLSLVEDLMTKEVEEKLCMKPGKAEFTHAAVLDLLKELQISDEQKRFYESWVKHVQEKAMTDYTHVQEMIIATDLDWVEFSSTGIASRMLDIAQHFHHHVTGDDHEGDLSQLNRLIRADRCQVWCRLKDIRQDLRSRQDSGGGGSPGVDCGFTLMAEGAQIIHWVDLDVIMHPCDDTDVFWKFAHAEKWPCVGCGSSFAAQPEHRMTVAPPEYSRNYLLAAFLYLRELGFRKPATRTMQDISNLRPGEFSVTAALGKEGIVRLEVNVDHPEPWKEKMDWAFVERWCTPYTHKPEHKDIERLTYNFKASPEGLRLIVDKRGFTAGLVWRNVTVPHKEGERI